MKFINIIVVNLFVVLTEIYVIKQSMYLSLEIRKISTIACCIFLVILISNNDNFFKPHQAIGVRNADVACLLWSRNLFLNTLRRVSALIVLSCFSNDSWPFLIFQNAISCLSPILRDHTGNSLLFTHAIVYLLRKQFLACLIIPSMSCWWWKTTLLCRLSGSILLLTPFLKCGLPAL